MSPDCLGIQLPILLHWTSETPIIKCFLPKVLSTFFYHSSLMYAVYTLWPLFPWVFRYMVQNARNIALVSTSCILSLCSCWDGWPIFWSLLRLYWGLQPHQEVDDPAGPYEESKHRQCNCCHCNLPIWPKHTISVKGLVSKLFIVSTWWLHA